MMEGNANIRGTVRAYICQQNPLLCSCLIDESSTLSLPPISSSIGNLCVDLHPVGFHSQGQGVFVLDSDKRLLTADPSSRTSSTQAPSEKLVFL